MTTTTNKNLLQVTHYQLSHNQEAQTPSFLPVIQQNRQDKERQKKQIREQYELVCFGHEYESVAAILTIYLAFKKSSRDKADLFLAAKDLGIDIFASCAKTEIAPLSETVYFGIIKFESYLELGSSKLCSLATRYLPYLAVRERENSNQIVTSQEARINLGLTFLSQLIS